MDVVISVAQLILSLSILVAVHEMGHLLAAKYFGMRVEQFSIGFPPKIWSFKKGETEYAISAIPLGGYVKISGMIDESLDTEAMNRPAEPWEFRSKPAWQRLIVMLGGIFVNVIMGIFIFICLTFFLGEEYLSKDEINKSGVVEIGPLGREIGLQDGDKVVKINGQDFTDYFDVYKPENLIASNASFTVDRGGELKEISIPHNFIENFNKKDTSLTFIDFRVPAVVGYIDPKSIAEKVGLEKGDKIVEIEGKQVQYMDEVNKGVKAIATDEISFSIERQGQIMRFHEKFPKEKHAIGIRSHATVHIEYGFLSSITVGTSRAFSTLTTQIKAFGKIIRGELSFQKNVSGPIGMTKAFGPTWNWVRFWTLTGLLSLVLAFMNLLPIPALDGGHVMFLSFEMLSGRKPSDKFLEVAQKVGMVFLLGLMVFIFANDIIKMISEYVG